MSNINLLYTDLSPTMDKAWNNDVAVTVGARAVKNSILGIITTRKGSRPFMPEFGCGLSDELFENMTPLTADTIQKNITAALTNYEPRLSRLYVQVTPLYDDNTIIITIYFSIVDNPDTLQEIKLQLQASR
ncbi:baseplate wedge subunit [Erwinia phage Cronus]|uniref:Baseplate wedge subunit n=1 Tax=Erwinia phage Cronus TaxID=2163633 RepID=A0A2S1GLU6_9CAUD|nr:baseplate wedge subunit [Erwinia phage Cronus]AWD90349.1 baseplate wedge subunit [Erwinia phage Cronus]